MVNTISGWDRSLIRSSKDSLYLSVTCGSLALHLFALGGHKDPGATPHRAQRFTFYRCAYDPVIIASLFLSPPTTVGCAPHPGGDSRLMDLRHIAHEIR